MSYTSEKIVRLNKMLESRFGVTIEAAPEDHLRAVLDHYSNRRDLLVRTMGEAAAHSSPEYAKAYLICEAVRMYLREIAPKRLRKKKK